jgi:hypothetical protein
MKIDSDHRAGICPSRSAARSDQSLPAASSLRNIFRVARRRSRLLAAKRAVHLDFAASDAP